MSVTVVIATRNRVGELRRTLDQLTGLPERPAVVVVDNASEDGTSAIIRAEYPGVTVITLPRNLAASARNVGAARASTRYVAFSDDDSWWEPGSLRRAAALLEEHAELGLVAARTLVGVLAEPDPINAVLRDSPLPAGRLPGPRVLGFLACAAVARREAFLAVGGFSELLVIGGEEQLLAMDLAAGGWAAVYADDVVARHWPSASRDDAARRRLLARNEVVVAWLRRPLSIAAPATAKLIRRAAADRTARQALTGLLRLLPAVLRQRQVVPGWVETQLRQLGRVTLDSARQQLAR